MTRYRWALFAALTLAALLFAACGDDDDDTGDPRRAQVGSVSENATYAWIEDGGEGIYDYLSTGVKDACTVDDVQAALDGSGIEPTDWRNTRDISVSDDTATGTVVFATDDGDKQQDWSFVLEDNSWRISELPGLEECAG